MAQTGLFSGNDTLPVDRTATDGFITFNVAPYGYKNDKALKIKQQTYLFNTLHDVYHKSIPD